MRACVCVCGGSHCLCVRVCVSALIFSPHNFERAVRGARELPPSLCTAINGPVQQCSRGIAADDELESDDFAAAAAAAAAAAG